MLSSDQKWIKDTISHRTNNRGVPYHFDFTPPASEKLARYFGDPDLENILGLPIRWAGPKSIKPLYADTKTYGKVLKDEFGVTWNISDKDRGTPIPCLAESDISKYKFPDPYESYRFEDLYEWCNENATHYRVIWAGDLWERATFIRGMENLLMDVATNKNFVKKLLRGIADYFIATMELMNERFDFEAFSISDDYGTQSDLMISPADWRSIIKPYLLEISKVAKKSGKELMIHSDGNIYSIIGDLIDIGIDIIHPIQPEAMDVYKLKKEFGELVTFEGGLSTQKLLSFGTPEEIQREIEKLKGKIGKNGGYILEPGITLQGDIPLENLIAMIEAAKSN